MRQSCIFNKMSILSASRYVEFSMELFPFANWKPQYSWLTTCIYIAILVIEYPTNWILQRVPIAKYLGANVMIWGAILALHASCHNFAGLATVRTLFGIFETCCQPSFVLLSSMWYKSEEQAAQFHTGRPDLLHYHSFLLSLRLTAL